MKIAFVGECMIELRDDAKGGIRQHFSGDTLNAAVYFCRQLGTCPVKTDFVTAIGTDRFSLAMLQFWQHEGIGCSQVRQMQDKVPGLYFIHVDANGERSFTYWRSDSAARFMFAGEEGERLLAQLAGYDGVYLSGITLAILADTSLEQMVAVLVALKARGGQIYFDTNFRPALWPDKARARLWYKRLLDMCDIAFVTLEDENLLFDTPTAEVILQRFANIPVPELVIKCGADPCRIRFKGQVFSIPAEQVTKVVDTTGAGDSFSAAYLAERLKGQAPALAAQAAHKVAAQVIGFSGAFAAA